MNEETRAKISKSQRARYEAQRKEQKRLAETLVRFALWLHPSWDDENYDDVMAATACVQHFLAAPEDA